MVLTFKAEERHQSPAEPMNADNDSHFSIHRRRKVMSRLGWIKWVIKLGMREWWSFWPPSLPPLSHFCPPHSRPVHPLLPSLSQNDTDCLPSSLLLSVFLCSFTPFSLYNHLFLSLCSSLPPPVSVSLTLSPSYQTGSEACGSCLQWRKQQGRAGRLKRLQSWSWVTELRALHCNKREYLDLKT